jgi:hypothetical protein
VAILLAGVFRWLHKLNLTLLSSELLATRSFRPGVLCVHITKGSCANVESETEICAGPMIVCTSNKFWGGVDATVYRPHFEWQDGGRFLKSQISYPLNSTITIP